MRRIIPFVIIFLVVSVFFAPLWSGQKIVLNGNFLVSFYAPWKFDKFTGFPAGVPAKQGGGYDQLRIGYPYFTQVWEAWRNLRVPLWNPYNFAGLPLAAETQSAAFYPLHFLAFFLPNMVIWNIFVVSGFFLAFLFMYLFLKDVTANTTASLFAGFTYAFCHFFIVWTQEVVTAQHAALWLPLALLAIRRLDSSKLWWFILTGAFILSILSGYIQVSIYVISTCLLYSLWQVKQPHVDSYKHFLVLLLVLASLGVALGLSAFQLLPLREMNAYSSRNIVDMRPFLKENLIPWYALLQLVVPDFFGNSGTWNHYGYPQGTFYEHMFAVSLPALMIAIYGFLSLRSPKDKFFFAFIAISPFIIIIDSPLSRSLFDLPIPVLSTSIANRILFLPAFGIASLAAMGIKNWQSDSFGKDKNLLLKIGLSLAIFTSFLLLFTLRSSYTLFRPFGFPVNWAMIGFRNSLLPSLILFVVILTILMVRKRIVTPGKVIVVCFFLAFLQTGLFMNKVVTFSDSRLLYPSHQLFDFLKSSGKYDRFWGFGDGYVENNLATIAQVYSPEGYDSLADRRYAQLLYTVGNQGRWTENISRSDATINRQTVDKSFIDDKRRQRLLSLLSVRYILHRYLPDTKRHDLRNDFVDPDLYSPLATMSGITIYENKQAFPRAYLAGRVLQRTENQAIIDTLFDRDIDPRHTAVLEESYSPYLEADPQGSVKIIDYQPEYVRLQSISSAPQMLVLTDVFYPGWRAFVDDQETKIYRTQFALRSIYLPNGSHSIEFRYNPQSFNLGLQISLSTLLLVIVVTMVVTLWIKKNPKRLAVHFILAGIVLLGCFLRIYQLGKNPPSLYWDEASLGYNAYAIANFGMDEHGERYPLARFTTFGDYKPPGYIYLAALSIKLFQLSEWSIRLPSALAGIVMVIVTYYLVVELLESRLVALVSSFFVAVSPWSLQLSRAAFEANVAACFNLIAIFFFLRAVKGKGLHLVVSVVFFMLAFYTFNANRIISPLLFLVLVVIWFSRRSSFLRTVVVSGIVAIVLLIPSIPFLVSKEGRLRFQEVSIFTNLDIVKVANSRVSRDAGNWLGQMLNNRRVLFVQELARHFLDHFDMRYLFLSGDRNPRLSIQSIGQFYFFEFFFLITGVIYIVKYGKKKALTILAWLIIALLPAATARETPHALRSASAIPVGQILSAMGLVFWIRHFRLHSWNRLFLMLTLVAFEFQTFFYFHNYYVHAPARWAGEWQYGYKQMVEYMKSHDQDYKSVIVTRRLGRPYIYFLLYEGISPQDYLSQRRAERDWWGLWEVYGFGKYYFDVGYLPKVEKPALFVGIPGEIPSEARILKTVISPSGELIFIIGEL